MINDLTVNPFEWVLCDDDLDYPVLVEWGNGVKGFLVTSPKGRRKDVWKYIDGYPAYICDLDDFMVVGEVGEMFEKITIYIIDHIDPDEDEICGKPWFSKTNNRVEVGKESKFTDAIMEIMKSRAADTERRMIYYGLEPR